MSSFSPSPVGPPRRLRHSRATGGKTGFEHGGRRMSLDLRSKPRTLLGRLGFVLGAAALLLILVEIFAGPFAPPPDAAQSLDMIADDLRATAERALSGEEPAEPAAQPWDTDRVISTIAGLMAGLAIILGVLGFVRQEAARSALGAIVLGAATVAIYLSA